MQFEGKGKLLRIYLNERTNYNNTLLYEAIVQKAYKLGLAGTMVFRGIEGYGFCCEMCRTRHEGMTISSCTPLVVEFIDSTEKINELLPVVKEMVKTGAVITQDADILFNKFQ